MHTFFHSCEPLKFTVAMEIKLEYEHTARHIVVVSLTHIERFASAL